MTDAQDDYEDGQDYSDDGSEVQVTGTRKLPKQRLVIDDDEDDDEDDGVMIKIEVKPAGDVTPRTNEWNNWNPSEEPAAKQ
jgi:hypothetical protein